MLKVPNWSHMFARLTNNTPYCDLSLLQHVEIVICIRDHSGPAVEHPIPDLEISGLIPAPSS